MSAKSVDEAAEYLRVSRSFLDHSRISGNGPSFYKIGRRIVYETADLDLWKESRRRHSTSEYSREAA